MEKYTQEIARVLWKRDFLIGTSASDDYIWWNNLPQEA